VVCGLSWAVGWSVLCTGLGSELGWAWLLSGLVCGMGCGLVCDVAGLGYSVLGCGLICAVGLGLSVLWAAVYAAPDCRPVWAVLWAGQG
jgi:hypothetical protein